MKKEKLKEARKIIVLAYQELGKRLNEADILLKEVKKESVKRGQRKETNKS